MFKFSSVTDLIIAINDVLENTLESISFEGEISSMREFNFSYSPWISDIPIKRFILKE